MASIATKLCDTFQSEIGKAYGKRCFLGEFGMNIRPTFRPPRLPARSPPCLLFLLLLVTNLKPVPRGTEGAVSVEGTAAGVVGAMVIAGYGCASGLTPWSSLPAILIASQVGRWMCSPPRERIFPYLSHSNPNARTGPRFTPTPPLIALHSPCTMARWVALLRASLVRLCKTTSLGSQTSL